MLNLPELSVKQGNNQALERKKKKRALAKRIQKVKDTTESDGHIPEVLRVLECLCTGKTSVQFQDFFRQQPGSQHQVDLIAIVFDFVDFTDDYVCEAEAYGIDVPLENLHRGLETIEMFVRGPNTENVNHIMKNSVKFLSVINSVLSNTRYLLEKGESPGEIHIELAKHKVVSSTLKLVKTLLESGDVQVAAILSNGINWALVLHRMTDLYTNLGLDDKSRHTKEGLQKSFEDIWDAQIDQADEDCDQEKVEDMRKQLLDIEDADGDDIPDNLLLLCTKNAGEDVPDLLEQLRSELILYYTVMMMLNNTEMQQSINLKRIEHMGQQSTLAGTKAGQAWELWQNCPGKGPHGPSLLYGNETIDKKTGTLVAGPYGEMVGPKTRKEMATYCSDSVKSCEIERSGRLETIFFPLTESGTKFLNDRFRKDNASENLTMGLKTDDGTEATLNALLSRFKEETFVILFEDAIDSCDWDICERLINHQSFIERAPKYLAYTINLFLIIFYTPKFIINDDGSYDAPGSNADALTHRIGEDTWGDNYAWEYDWLGYIEFALSILHVFFSLLRMAKFSVLKAMPVGYTQWHKAQQDKAELQEMVNHGNDDAIEDQEESKRIKGFIKLLTKPGQMFINLFMSPVRAGLQEKVFMKLQEDAWFVKAQAQATKKNKQPFEIPLQVGIDSLESQLLVYYLLCSCLGMLIHPIFFAIHTLEMFTNPVAQLVLVAVFKHIEKMTQCLMIMGVVTYLYAFIGMLYFWQEHDDYTKTCSTLWQCMMSYFDQGLKSDGIADLLAGQTDTGFPEHIWTDGKGTALLLWNFSYFLIVVLILGAIVTGIIIDTFGELRDEANAQSERLSNSCIICGISRQRFVQCPGASFAAHRASSHNEFHYLAYFLYLKQMNTNESEMSPQERHVYQNFVAEKTLFFPMEKTGDLLSEEQRDEGESLEDRMSKLEEAILSLKGGD